jgi:hypothetical protein
LERELYRNHSSVTSAPQLKGRLSTAVHCPDGGTAPTHAHALSHIFFCKHAAMGAHTDSRDGEAVVNDAASAVESLTLQDHQVQALPFRSSLLSIDSASQRVQTRPTF